MLAPKPWTTVSEQIRKLHTRGMDVSWDQTEHWLQAVGYYRLSGYWHPFRIRLGEDIVSKMFAPGTSFRETAQLYEFDRKLKIHMLSGIERVEVAMRTRIADVLGERSSMALWERDQFRDGSRAAELIAIMRKRIHRAIDSRDPVALHHQEKYGERFPVWVAVEFLDFTDVSRLYESLQPVDQEAVATWFGWVPPVRHPEAKFGAPMGNWLRHLTVVRNTAAHQARLWNRVFEPVSAKKLSMVEGLGELRGQQGHLYGSVVVLARLLQAASPGSTWALQLRALLEASFAPLLSVSWSQMGFPEDWKSLPPFRFPSSGRTTG